MRRRAILMAMALTLISCGDEESRTASERPMGADPGKVVETAGRIGEATSATAKTGTRRLSPGGRPNPAPRPRPGGGVGVGAGAGCEQEDLDPAQGNLATITATTLCLINAERTSRGMGPVRPNQDLASAAARHAGDMVRRSYFAHRSPDGTDVVSRVKATGYMRGVSSWSVGENLAWGTGTLGRPGSIVNAWMNSPGHRANILQSRFREIGFGIVLDNPLSAGGATYVTAFGFTEPASAGREPTTRSGTGSSATRTRSSARRARAAARRRCGRLRKASSRKRCRARAARLR